MATIIQQLSLSNIWEFIKSLDWILSVLLFVVSVRFAASCWMFWREEHYKHNIKWEFMEIKVPREILKGPKAMEQFFAGLYTQSNTPDDWKEKWWDGEITRWFSLEIAGIKGQTHFYVRIPRVLKNAFTSLLYAQYPDVELVPAEDYIGLQPESYHELHKNKYEIYGLEVHTSKPPAYGLQTYTEFEQKLGSEKGRITDPIAPVFEIIGQLMPEETLWIQFLIWPDVHKHWHHDADEIVQELRDTTEETGKDDDGNAIYKFRQRSPDEDATIKQIEEKKTKACFESVIRYIYIAPKDIYRYDLPYRGTFAYFNQLRNDHQSFSKNNPIRTRIEWQKWPYIFPRKRLYWRRVAVYDEYRRRFIPEETFIGKLYNSYLFAWCVWHKLTILSAEELATLYHIPTNVVLTGTTMNRIESKRLSPPSQLPG